MWKSRENDSEYPIWMPLPLRFPLLALWLLSSPQSICGVFHNKLQVFVPLNLMLRRGQEFGVCVLGLLLLWS